MDTTEPVVIGFTPNDPGIVDRATFAVIGQAHRQRRHWVNAQRVMIDVLVRKIERARKRGTTSHVLVQVRDLETLVAYYQTKIDDLERAWTRQFATAFEDAVKAETLAP